MSKILAIDYGFKRCGIAITDDLKMIASPLTTIETPLMDEFLKKQIEGNKVDEIVIGWPVNLKGEDTNATKAVEQFFNTTKQKYPLIRIELLDERFTSLLAQKSIHMMQLPKNKREKKGLLDKVSAAIILQNYLESRKK